MNRFSEYSKITNFVTYKNDFSFDMLTTLIAQLANQYQNNCPNKVKIAKFCDFHFIKFTRQLMNY